MQSMRSLATLIFSTALLCVASACAERDPSSITPPDKKDISFTDNRGILQKLNEFWMVPQSSAKDFAPAVYNKPHWLRLGKTTEISLVIQTSKDQDISEELSFLPGELTTTQFRISSQMSAYLSGPDVEITLQAGDAKKAVSKRAPTQWIWHVRPKTAGKTVLTLDVFAYLPVKGKTAEIKVRTYRDEIPVTATWFEDAQEFVKNIEPIRASVFATIAGLAAAAAWAIAQFRRQNAGGDV